VDATGDDAAPLCKGSIQEKPRRAELKPQEEEEGPVPM